MVPAATTDAAAAAPTASTGTSTGAITEEAGTMAVARAAHRQPGDLGSPASRGGEDFTTRKKNRHGLMSAVEGIDMHILFGRT